MSAEVKGLLPLRSPPEQCVLIVLVLLERSSKITMDEGIVASLADIDRKMGIMDPKGDFLGCQQIFQCCLRAERE